MLRNHYWIELQHLKHPFYPTCKADKDRFQGLRKGSNDNRLLLEAGGAIVLASAMVLTNANLALAISGGRGLQRDRWFVSFHYNKYP